MRRCSVRGWRGRAAAAALVVAALWALLWRGAGARLADDLLLPAPAHSIAAALADFANHPSLYPNIGSWHIKEEESNFTVWRYSVGFECGPRCSGAARVLHEALHEARRGPTHLAVNTHRLFFTHTYCHNFPLLPWPRVCDEVSTEVEVSSDSVGAAAGSRVRLLATGRCRHGAGCGALSALPGAVRTLVLTL